MRLLGQADPWASAIVAQVASNRLSKSPALIGMFGSGLCRLIPVVGINSETTDPILLSLPPSHDGEGQEFSSRSVARNLGLQIVLAQYISLSDGVGLRSFIRSCTSERECIPLNQASESESCCFLRDHRVRSFLNITKDAINKVVDKATIAGRNTEVIDSLSPDMNP